MFWSKEGEMSTSPSSGRTTEQYFLDEWRSFSGVLRTAIMDVEAVTGNPEEAAKRLDALYEKLSNGPGKARYLASIARQIVRAREATVEAREVESSA